MQLRPYQRAAVDAVVDAWSAGFHAPVIALPTGGGKTVTAAHLLRDIRDNVGLRTAWLTDREILMEQTRGELEACGLSVALVQAPSWKTPPADVMAADVLLVMVQTARSRGWLPEDLGIGCMVHDEAHIEHGIVRLWLETGIPACGLSATPIAKWMHQETDASVGRADPARGDRNVNLTAGKYRQFGPWTGPLVAPLSTRSLINDDVLLAPVFRVDIPDPAERKDPLTGERYARAGEDWSAEEAEQIMSPHTRAIAERWRALCDAPASEGGYDGAQPPTLVQAATIDHAAALADAFRRAARDRYSAARRVEGPSICSGSVGQAGQGQVRPTDAGIDSRRSAPPNHASDNDGGADGSRDSGREGESLWIGANSQVGHPATNPVQLRPPSSLEPTVAKRKTQPTGAAQADAGSTPAGRQPIWRVLSARQSTDESRKIMADFRAGKIHGLVAVHKLSIGADAPDATIFVSARPTRSFIVWVQSVGRVIRKPQTERGVPCVTVLDCAGNAHRHAGRLHRFWSDGPKWPFPASPPAGAGSGQGFDGALPLPCDDHPTVFHHAGSTVCSVCFKPLREPEPVEEAKTFRADQVSLRELARTVLRLAQDRACRPPLDGGESARKWAWMQVKTLTGRNPENWPPADWREREWGDPHPVVRRTIKRNGRSYRTWMEMQPGERMEKPEQEQVAWTTQ